MPHAVRSGQCTGREPASVHQRFYLHGGRGNEITLAAQTRSLSPNTGNSNYVVVAQEPGRPFPNIYNHTIHIIIQNIAAGGNAHEASPRKPGQTGIWTRRGTAPPADGMAASDRLTVIEEKLFVMRQTREGQPRQAARTRCHDTALRSQMRPISCEGSDPTSS